MDWSTESIEATARELLTQLLSVQLYIQITVVAVALLLAWFVAGLLARRVRVFSHEPEDWRTAAGLLQSGALAADLDSLVTARYGLSEVADALALTVAEPVYRVMVG